MKKEYWKRMMAVLLGVVLVLTTPVRTLPVLMTSFAYTERPATVNASSLNVRSGAGTGNSVAAKLSRGASVTVTGETTGSDGKLWYQIRFMSGGTAKTGYVLNTYLSFAANYQYNADFEAQLSAQGFPESYKPALRQLHTKYPNWVFEAQKTGLDWSTAVQNEMVLPRSLVGSGSISSYKSVADGAYNWDTSTWTGFDGSAWVAASQEILSFYMDPRNFLDEVSVFQFMSHQYDANLQTREGLQNILRGTFLEGTVNGSQGAVSGGSSLPSGGSGSSPVPSGGPGGSSGNTGSSSPGVIVSPSGGKGGSYGPAGPSQPGSAPAGGGNQPEVQLTAPRASVSPRETAVVAVSVTVGAKPGDDTGSTGNTGNTGNTVNPGNTGNPGVVQTPVKDTGGSNPAGTSSAASQGNRSYADIIMDAAAQSGVNPYVLAAMILQEQGSDGRGRSVSGTVSGYNGYYNYFNVGAYASDGLGAVERGLWYASQNDSYGRPWNTPEKSILGGAQFYGDNYVKAGQDTFYLKKYNVQGSNMYKHQYMTNVDGAASEASFFAEAYSGGAKSAALRFRIPVYNNMPETVCAKPVGDGSPNNKLNSLGVEGYVLTPTFSPNTERYDLIVDPSVTSVNVYANAADSSAAIQGTGTVQLAYGMTDINVQVTAQNKTVRNYVIHVVKQGGGNVYQGGQPSSGSTAPSPGGSGTVTGTGPGAGTGSTQTSPIGGNNSLPTPGGSNVTIIN